MPIVATYFVQQFHGKFSHNLPYLNVFLIAFFIKLIMEYRNEEDINTQEDANFRSSFFISAVIVFTNRNTIWLSNLQTTFEDDW